MAGRAEQNEIAHLVVMPVAIQVRDFQHVLDAEAAMSTEQPVVVVLESEFAIVDALHSGFTL